MPRITQNIHLSEYQARVMLITHQAQTPQLAFAELGNQDERIEDNLLGQRDLLAKMGLLAMTTDTLEVTPEGEEVMRDENLIDESGQVTQRGEEILQREEGEMGPQEEPPGGEPPADQGAEMAPTTAGGEMETTQGEMGMPPMESSMLKFVNDLAKLQG